MKKICWIVALIMFGLGMQTAVAAKLYKWVDEFGNVTYRDTPPLEEGAEYQVQDFGAREREEGSPEMEAAAEKSPVVLYSTPQCKPCVGARNFLNARGIPFEEKDVSTSTRIQAELKQKAGELSVPTILVGEKVMRGYVESLLDGELDAAGYPKPGSAQQNEEAIPEDTEPVEEAPLFENEPPEQ